MRPTRCRCLLRSLHALQAVGSHLPAHRAGFRFYLLSDCHAAPLRRRIWFHLGYWMILLPVSVRAFPVLWRAGRSRSVEAHPAYSYFITQAFSVVKYLQLILVPVGQCADHGITPALSLSEPSVLPSWLFLVALFTATYWAYRKRTDVAKLTVFYVVWFFLNIAPTTSFLPTTAVVVENRVYLPGMAWAGLFALGYFLSGGRRAGRTPAPAHRGARGPRACMSACWAAWPMRATASTPRAKIFGTMSSAPIRDTAGRRRCSGICIIYDRALHNNDKALRALPESRVPSIKYVTKHRNGAFITIWGRSITSATTSPTRSMPTSMRWPFIRITITPTKTWPTCTM